MTPQDQIKYLNEVIKVFLAPSSIQGVGTFALRDIAKGEKLYADLVPQVFSPSFKEMEELYPDIKEMILGQWPQIVNGSKFAYPTTRIQAFMNHSDEPNYDAFSDLALKAIKKGEEITEDYRKIPSYQQIFPWLVKDVV